MIRNFCHSAAFYLEANSKIEKKLESFKDISSGSPEAEVNNIYF